MTTIESISSTNPFAVITFIAAPAILTNAASILALSTSTRFLRSADRIREFGDKLEAAPSARVREFCISQINRSRRQSSFFLIALQAVYFALACFAVATVIALLGASLAPFIPRGAVQSAAGLSLVIGVGGISALVWACWRLIQASRLTMLNIRDDIEQMQARHLLPTPDPAAGETRT